MTPKKPNQPKREKGRVYWVERANYGKDVDICFGRRFLISMCYKEAKHHFSLKPGERAKFFLPQARRVKP